MIKNILFDLGGVLLNINYQRTEQAFVDLGLPLFKQLYTQNKQIALFNLFETGQISKQTFIAEIEGILDQPVEATSIVNAWNAMLLDFPIHRLEMLRALKQTHRVFLISNTNQIHYEAFNEIFERTFKHEFSSYFHQDYYSHLLGLRKPNAEIFEHVLQENGLNKAETLFIDDTKVHVDAAKTLGLKTAWLEQEDVSELLTRVGILT